MVGALVFAVFVGLSVQTAAKPQAAQPQGVPLVKDPILAAGVEQLKKDFPNAQVNIDDVTQKITSVELGRPRAPESEQDAAKLALKFLAQRGNALFAVPQPQAELRVVSQQRDPQLPDRAMVHIQQFVRDVPVFGAEMVMSVRTGPSAAVTSITTNVAPVPAIATTPAIDSSAATQAARAEYERVNAALRDNEKLPPLATARTSASLVVFDPPRLKLRGSTALAWLVNIDNVRFFVDATTGAVLYRYRNMPHGLSRMTYECPADCVLVLTEGGPLASSVSQTAATMHSAAQTVHAYFHSRFGRDGFDDVGAGGQVPLSVQVLIPAWANAAYEPVGKSFKFGDGWATLDIFVHEYAHAVMFHRPVIEYFSESGAVHEFFADLFAALQTGQSPDQWILGEGVANLPGNRKYLRDMRDPNAGAFDRSAPYDAARNYGQPATLAEQVSSADAICASIPPFNDNDCVHFNGAILSKAATLATDGGTVNGVTVAGLGVSKMERIAYGALLRLAGFVTLEGAADAQLMACAEYRDAKKFNVTASDCTELAKALTAVGFTR